VGVASIAHFEPTKHFAQFRLSKESEVANNIWLCVWIVVVGELWNKGTRRFLGTEQ